MERIQLATNLEISRVIHGHWRLLEWRLSDQELLSLVKSTHQLGVTTVDHADIYGDYACEQKLGSALSLDPSFRQQMEIISKCGIKLLSEKRPNQKVKYYDYSKSHIISSVEQSLKNLGTDYLDLLLLHRPSPFFSPDEVAAAFEQLQHQGKVLHFGVSNFNSSQIELIKSAWKGQLLANQIEVSAYEITPFENGDLDYLQTNDMLPMAWSPLAGGSIFSPQDEKGHRLINSLYEISSELGGVSLDYLLYAWLLQHPSNISPVVGTSKLERINAAVHAVDLKLSTEQWYRIYIAAKGEELP